MRVNAVNSFGRLWTPKQSRLYVGRDVLAMPTSKSEKTPDWLKGIKDDVSVISDEARAKYQASRTENAFGAHNVQLSDGRSIEVKLGGEDLQSGGKIIEIHVPGEAEARRYTISEDTRITFDEKGVPQFFSGADASQGGVLRAQGKDEILLNFSSNKVEAGENSTVINFAGEGGDFVSGFNTTYLGAYSGAKFSGGKGELTFAGVFDNSELNVGAGKGVFSGVFREGTINGGAQNDVFSGFFNGAKAYGGDGNDAFSGSFIDGALVDAGAGDDVIDGELFLRSNILAGEGDDAIGDFRLKGDEAVSFQFVNSTLDTGDGDNKVSAAALNSVIKLGKGDNRAYGIFQNSTISNPEGNAEITALLSNRTNYVTGQGETKMTLATALHNEITTGEGKSDVNIGVDPNKNYNENIDGEHRSLEHLDWVYSKRGKHDFGETDGNNVNLEKGDAKLKVFTGENSYSVHARNEEVETDKLDPATGLPEKELQRLVDVSENLAADTSMVRTAANVRLSFDLMLKFQAEDKGNLPEYRSASRGYRAYSYNLGRV